MKTIAEWLKEKTEPFYDELPSDKYGVSPEERNIELYLEYGFVPLDKPPGYSSFEVVSWVKRMLKAKKAGHSGTLDPSVSGLLPIAINSATKALSALLLGPKEYIAVMKLHENLPAEKVVQAINMFKGMIYQRPPVRSSVKRNIRVRKVYNIEILENDERFYLIRLLVESGTYIRKIIYDIGELLKVGATMVDLRRTRVADYTESDGFVKLQDVWEASKAYRENNDETKLRNVVKPVEVSLRHLKPIVVKNSAIGSICNGAPLALPGVSRVDPTIEANEWVALYSVKGEIVAIGKTLVSYKEMETMQKGIIVNVDRVIMKQDTYPRIWKTR
ncbi:MAG: RNA-guided pseudouridylation complex pseudouridine synthase subunit Cbf5 [Nitrososphaeria archaeon]|jgi:H/ACA ribonucleoprotein complex subunit 4